MPREFTLITRRVPDRDDLRAAASEAGWPARVGAGPEGVADVLLDDAGRRLLSLEATIRVSVPDELHRLVPEVAGDFPDGAFWTSAWAPFGAAIDPEAGEQVARAIARRCDGVVVTDVP